MKKKIQIKKLFDMVFLKVKQTKIRNINLKSLDNS